MAIALPAVQATGLLRYRLWTLAAAVACMPLFVVRFGAGPMRTTVLELLLLLTIAVYVAAAFQTRSWTIPRTALEVPLALFLLAALMGVVVSFDHFGALGLFRAYFLEPVLIFYIALDVLRTPRAFRVVIAAFVAGATVFAILNLGVWAITLARHLTIVSTDAPNALYDNPNSVAMFLGPAIALAAGIALYSDSNRDRAAALLSLVVLLASMVLTLSRAGLLTLAVLALLAVITMPQRRTKLLLLGGAIIGGLLVSRIPWVELRLVRQFDPAYRDNTFEGRLQIWSDTLHMLRDHPIFGAGLRAYAHVVAPYVSAPTGPQLHPHNVLLALWSDIGLLGLLAFAAMVSILLWKGWRGFGSSSGFVRAVLWGASAGIVAVVVHGMFDATYLRNDLSLEFWMLAALELAALAAVARDRTREPGKQR